MTLELKQIIEALLFSAERPLSPKEIRAIFAEATDEENSPAVSEPFRNVREAQIVATLEELKAECELQRHSYQLVEIAGGWRLVTRPEYAPWLKKLLDEARPHRLSPPSLETLAIIALRQPISRADIAAIRGVEVDGVIKTLLERDMITIVGKSEAPGRPMLYGTTQKFLEHFGLRDIDDMPKAAELRLQAAALKTAEQKAESSFAKATEDEEAQAKATDAAGSGTDALQTATPHPNPLPHGERGDVSSPPGGEDKGEGDGIRS
ncbi:MAG: SMC-Scp complex subunit ScpB [Verrucomicrobiia bacterium]